MKRVLKEFKELLKEKPEGFLDAEKFLKVALGTITRAVHRNIGRGLGEEGKIKFNLEAYDKEGYNHISEARIHEKISDRVASHPEIRKILSIIKKPRLVFAPEREIDIYDIYSDRLPNIKRYVVLDNEIIELFKMYGTYNPHLLEKDEHELLSYLLAENEGEEEIIRHLMYRLPREELLERWEDIRRKFSDEELRSLLVRFRGDDIRNLLDRKEEELRGALPFLRKVGIFNEKVLELATRLSKHPASHLLIPHFNKIMLFSVREPEEMERFLKVVRDNPDILTHVRGLDDIKRVAQAERKGLDPKKIELLLEHNMDLSDAHLLDIEWFRNGLKRGMSVGTLKNVYLHPVKNKKALLELIRKVGRDILEYDVSDRDVSKLLQAKIVDLDAAVSLSKLNIHLHPEFQRLYREGVPPERLKQLEEMGVNPDILRGIPPHKVEAILSYVGNKISAKDVESLLTFKTDVIKRGGRKERTSLKDPEKYAQNLLKHLRVTKDGYRFRGGSVPKVLRKKVYKSVEDLLKDIKAHLYLKYSKEDAEEVISILQNKVPSLLPNKVVKEEQYVRENYGDVVPVLRSLYRSLPHIKISREGEYIIFRHTKSFHDSTALFSPKFLRILREVGGSISIQKPYEKGENRLKVHRDVLSYLLSHDSISNVREVKELRKRLKL